MTITSQNTNPVADSTLPEPFPYAWPIAWTAIAVCAVLVALWFVYVSWRARNLTVSGYRVHIVRHRGRLQNDGFIVSDDFPTRTETIGPNKLQFSVYPDYETAKSARDLSIADPDEPRVPVDHVRKVIEICENNRWVPADMRHGRGETNDRPSQPN